MSSHTPSSHGLAARRDQIALLCRSHHVRRLDLFGSVLGGLATAGSDYDFLVEFQALPPGDYSKAYFGLLDGLQALLQAPVDLVVERAIRNPYLRQAVERERASVYAT